MIKYKAGGYRNAIEKVEVLRETAKFVVFPGSGNSTQRSAKFSDYMSYFDTWDEAHAWLLNKAKRQVAITSARFERAKDKLRKIESLKRPKD